MSTYAARLDIEVPTRAGDLPAPLTVPPSPQGLVIFAVTQGARSLPAHRALAETLRGIFSGEVPAALSTLTAATTVPATSPTSAER